VYEPLKDSAAITAANQFFDDLLALVADSLRLITWVARNRVYPDELGYGDTFEALWQQWRAHTPLL
jgi:hypothetical protein